MNLINVKNFNAADVTDGLLTTEFPPSTGMESDLPVLADWEMVLASGGEASPCW